MARFVEAALLATIFSLFAVPTLAAVPACVADVGQRPQLPGIEVRELRETEGNYGILRVETANGAHMLVYYDEGSEAFAYSRAACLGAQLAFLQTELGDTRKEAEWNSVVFTTDHAYVPPHREAVRPRWVVQTKRSDTPWVDPDQMILVVIPHEQVHDFQGRASARTPQWFSEGHATWMGTRITSLLQEGRGQTERAMVKAALAEARGPVDLAGWGSVRPRREAIMRQVSAEDRSRMEADPAYMPPGTFRFTADDLESDESNTGARYAAALSIFEGLEQRHGAPAVSAWTYEVTSTSGTVTPDNLADSVQRHFGEDLDELLAEQPTN